MGHLTKSDSNWYHAWSEQACGKMDGPTGTHTWQVYNKFYFCKYSKTDYNVSLGRNCCRSGSSPTRSGVPSSWRPPNDIILTSVSLPKRKTNWALHYLLVWKSWKLFLLEKRNKIEQLALNPRTQTSCMSSTKLMVGKVFTKPLRDVDGCLIHIR